MSTTTSNYGLKKPVDADNADLKIFVGQNMDTIDAELLKKLNKDATTGKVSKSDLPTLDPVFFTNTNPTNSSFFAHAQAGGQAMTAGGILKIQFPNTDWDTLGEYDPTTNYRFKVKTAGIYFVTCCMRLSGAVTNTSFIAIYKNGVEFLRMQNFVNGGTASSVVQAHGNSIVKLNVDDYLEIYGYSSVATTIQGTSAMSSGAHPTFFGAIKIG